MNNHHNHNNINNLPDPSEKFYDMQEDGTILCKTKADCPADVPGQVMMILMTTAFPLIKSKHLKGKFQGIRLSCHGN